MWYVQGILCENVRNVQVILCEYVSYVQGNLWGKCELCPQVELSGTKLGYVTSIATVVSDRPFRDSISGSWCSLPRVSMALTILGILLCKPLAVMANLGVAVGGAGVDAGVEGRALECKRAEDMVALALPRGLRSRDNDC